MQVHALASPGRLEGVMVSLGLDIGLMVSPLYQYRTARFVS